MIKITINSPPTAKGRPRKGKYGNMYTPTKTRKYEELVGEEALLHKPKELLTEALEVTMGFYLPIPKSWSKNKKKMALSGKLKHIVKPDLSNLVKAIEDALNGIIWKDDSQIIDEHPYKLYSDRPGTIIVIEEVK